MGMLAVDQLPQPAVEIPDRLMRGVVSVTLVEVDQPRGELRAWMMTHLRGR